MLVMKCDFTDFATLAANSCGEPDSWSDCEIVDADACRRAELKPYPEMCAEVDSTSDVDCDPCVVEDWTLCWEAWRATLNLDDDCDCTDIRRTLLKLCVDMSTSLDPSACSLVDAASSLSSSSLLKSSSDD